MPGEIPFSERSEFRKWWQVFLGKTFWSGTSGTTPSYQSNDPVYELWVQQGKPSAKEWLAEFEPVKDNAGDIVSWQTKPVPPPSPAEQKAQFNKEQLAQFKSNLPNIVGVKNLNDALQGLVDQGIISEYEREDYYNANKEQADWNQRNYLDYLGASQEVKDYLGAFTSKDDLADLIVKRLDTDPQTKEAIFKNVLFAQGYEVTNTDLFAIREATGRIQREREQYFGDVTSRLSDIYNNPFTKPEDLTRLREAQALIENPQSADAVSQLLQDITAEINYRGAEEQFNVNKLLAATHGTKKDEFQRPLMPGAEQVVQSYLSGNKQADLNLPEGTRLQSFIASQLPREVMGAEAARQAWWERMNPTPQTLTYEGEVARLTGLRDKWARVITETPTSTSASESYWGPGGLASIAQSSYETAQSKLANLRPENFGEPESVGFEEDPLLTRLKQKNWRAEYNRLPGVGIQRNLAPAVRF